MNHVAMEVSGRADHDAGVLQMRSIVEDVRVVVVDDVEFSRRALRGELHADPRLEVAADVPHDSAAAAVRRWRPDVVVVNATVIEAAVTSVEACVRAADDVRVVVFAGSEALEDLAAVFDAGAHGYVSMAEPISELVAAVTASRYASSVLSRRMLRCVINAFSRVEDLPRLNDKEVKVLRMLASGRTDDEIAESLYVSRRTVQYQLAHLREKAGVQRRAELTRWAAENRLL